MDTPKTLATRLREAYEAAKYRSGDSASIPVRIYDFMKAMEGDFLPALERLSAPDVGVELTRYTLWADARNSKVIRETHPNGEWVRYEDVAPLLAALTARTEAENAEHNRWMAQVAAERDEARAEVAASIAEIAKLREVLAGEPTTAMVEAGTEARWRSPVRDANNVREIWRAMTAALSGRKLDTKIKQP